MTDETLTGEQAELSLAPTPAPTAVEALIERLAAKETEKFDWFEDESVIVKEQLAIAVYANKAGGITICQRDFDEEPIIVVRPEYVPALVKRLQDVAAEIRQEEQAGGAK